MKRACGGSGNDGQQTRSPPPPRHLKKRHLKKRPLKNGRLKNARRKSGGEAARTLDEIAGAHPEALEPAQRHDDTVQIPIGDRGLRQELDMAAMHDAQLVAQGAPLVGKPDVDRAPVMYRALLHEIVVLYHLLDVVGNVRAEIAAAQRQLSD